MRIIIPNQTFKHDSETYREGQEYKVSDGDAQYFEENGWVGVRSQSAKVQLLNIQDVKLGHLAEVN